MIEHVIMIIINNMKDDEANSLKSGWIFKFIQDYKIT